MYLFLSIKTEAFTIIIILASAVFLGFFVQTIVGFAAALVTMPILLFVQDIQEAVAFMSIFFFIFSAILIYRNRKDIDKKIVGEMALGIIAGLFIGIYILKYGNPIVLKKLLGVFVILYVGYSLMKEKRIELLKRLGLVFGFAGGIFSGLFATGGPLYVMYLHNKLEKGHVLRATLIGTLGIVNFLRVPVLMYNGLLTYKIFIQALYVMPFFLASIYLGEMLYSKINDEIFKNILLVLLVLAGISLIVG